MIQRLLTKIKKRNSFIGNAFIYTITNLIRSSIPFLLLPILTRYLKPEDYGIIATFQVILSVVLILVNMNMRGAVSVNYFKMNTDELKHYIWNVAFLFLLSSLVLLTVFYFFLNRISYIINFPYGGWIIGSVIIALAQSFYTLVLTIWQAGEKPLSYGIFQISFTSLNVGLSLLFVVVYHMEWKGRLSGIALSSVLFGIIGLYLLKKKSLIATKLNLKYLRDALIFGLPLIPAAIGWKIITGIDRFFINSMVDVATTGIYAVGYQFGFIIGILANSFNAAWWPFLFKELKKNEYQAKIRIVRVTYLYNAVIILAALLLSLISPKLIKIFIGKNYHSAYHYVLWISLGFAFNGMRFMILNYIYYVKKTYLSAWIPFLSAGVNIGLNYYLIKVNGAVGAAQATAFTFFLSFILTWMVSMKVYTMPWLEVFYSKKKQ